MGNSTVWSWLVFAGGLLAVYFMMCRLTEEHLKKWAEKENKKAHNCTEHERLLNNTILYPMLWAFILLLSIVWLGAVRALYQELPKKIMGNWPIYQGTIVGYSEGYKSSLGYTEIQNGTETRSFRIKNAYGQQGHMIGMTVRVTYNEPDAYILEYEESGSWIKLYELPNSGIENYVVAKTIGMNLLAVIVTCGLIIAKIQKPGQNSFFKNRHLHNVIGVLLLVLSICNGFVLCSAVIEFPKNGISENFLMNSQLSMLILLCLNVVFCIMASLKTHVFRYWIKTAKEFILYSNN